MATIQTTNGFIVEFDDEDAALVMQYKWHSPAPRWGTRYARKTAPPQIEMHRLILGFPPYMVDHRDRNGLNNRRSNLRPATASQNSSNSVFRPGQIRFRGVTRSTRKTTIFAQIKVNGKSIYLGSFRDEVSAAKAYDAAAIAHFGEFASLNFPEGASA